MYDSNETLNVINVSVTSGRCCECNALNAFSFAPLLINDTELLITTADGLKNKRLIVLNYRNRSEFGSLVSGDYCTLKYYYFCLGAVFVLEKV